jgi:starch synthase
MNNEALPRPRACARRGETGPHLAIVSASDWDSAVAKGVASVLRDFEEGGYFAKVTTIFPFAPRGLEMALSDRHRLVQFGYDAFPGARRYRAVRLALAPFLVARMALLMRQIVREERIDIVRATDPYWCGLLGWFATVGSTAAFCVSVHAHWDLCHRLDPRHGAPKLFGSRRLAKLVERFVFGMARSVLCIRRSLLDYAVASGAARERTRLIPHGVDLRLFETSREDVRRTFGLPDAAKLVVFVGRLVRENYVYEMLDLARALADIDDLRVVLVGGGIEEQAVRAAVAGDPRLSRMVVMTGFVPRETAIAFRKAATVNVVPMGGYSLIEACASGRPVVAYDVEWHAELVRDGESGILVRENDVEALAKAVRRLLADEELARRLGAAGRSRAFQLHDIEKVRQYRIACYEELLARS